MLTGLYAFPVTPFHHHQLDKKIATNYYNGLWIAE